jgi:hypothetical protein
VNDSTWAARIAGYALPESEWGGRVFAVVDFSVALKDGHMVSADFG